MTRITLLAHPAADERKIPLKEGNASNGGPARQREPVATRAHDRGIFYTAAAREAYPLFMHPKRDGTVSLTADDVRNVARLARLGLDEAAIAEYSRQLSSILDVVDHLQRADASDVEPMAHPLDLTARLRPDVARATVDREAFQAIAPDTAEGLYRVPKVIE